MRIQLTLASVLSLALLPSPVSAQHAGSKPAAAGTSLDRMTPEALVLTPKVKSALIADKQLDSTRINVDTMKGAVVLRGSVRSAGEKQRAAQIAKKALGDEQSKYKLINHLKVGSKSANVG